MRHPRSYAQPGHNYVHVRAVFQGSAQSSSRHSRLRQPDTPRVAPRSDPEPVDDGLMGSLHLVSVGPSQVKTNAHSAYPNDHGFVHICGQLCGRRGYAEHNTTREQADPAGPTAVGCQHARPTSTGHGTRIGELAVADDSVSGNAAPRVDDLTQAWTRVLAGLPPNQRAWLANSKPVTLHESTAIVAVPDDFTRGQLETRLRPDLARILTESFGRDIRIAVTVDSSLDPDTAEQPAPSPPPLQLHTEPPAAVATGTAPSPSFEQRVLDRRADQPTLPT